MKRIRDTVLRAKREGRAAVAERSFSEKIAILEILRERDRAIAANPLRSAAKPHDPRVPG